VISISTMLLAGDRIDVLETSSGTPFTGNIGNVNLNGDPTTFLDGTGNWQFIQPPTILGTVAPLNLDGNIAHWLRGDGVWANIPVAEGNISNIDLNGNTAQYLNGAGVWTNIAVPTGNIANTNYNGNADQYLNGQGNWVPVVSGGIPGGSNTQLQFNNNGVFGGVPNSSFNGTKLTLGSNTNIKLTGGNVGDVLLTDGTGNLFWRNVINYAAVPRMEFQVLSNGAGQTFNNANLSVYPDSNYATVFRNGVLMDPTDYTISGSNITFSIPLYASESIDIAASAAAGNGGGNIIPNVSAPYIEWAVATSAAGQTFTNPNLSLYADKSDLSLFRNGVLISPSDYSLSGNSITVSTFLAAGDNLEVISKLVSGSGSGGVTNPAGNTTQIQFNDGGVFGADANLSFQKSIGALLTRSVETTLSLTSPFVYSPLIGSQGRDLTVFSGGTGIGSGNITIASSGNPATGGGNIYLQSGASNTTSNIYIGLPTQTANNRSRTTITGDLVFASPPAAPATATSPGMTGEIRWASGFIYVCVATNTWQRSPLTTW